MLVAALLVLLVVGAAIWIGRGEVVTLHTTDAEGVESFETHLWIAEHQGRLYLQGRPDRAWVQRLLAHPRVELERGGDVRSYDARPVSDPDETAAVDAAMAEKYGSADRLGHAVFDRQPAIAIRLDPVAPTPAAAPSPDTAAPQG